MADDVINMASNVTWSANDSNVTSRLSDGGSEVVDQRIIRVITLPIYLAAFVFGVTGNTLVIYVVVRLVVQSLDEV